MKEIFELESPGLRDFQAFHKAFDEERKFDVDMLRNCAYLSEEVGEVVDAIRSMQKAANSAEVETARDHIGEELADCLAYILKLANYGSIDLQAAYLKKMERNLTRVWPSQGE